MAIDADPHSIKTFAQAEPCVLVTLSETKGSTPRIQGTQMLVNKTSVLGTIGGGQLEYLAIDAARALSRDETAKPKIAVPLGPEIGQCCGGHVTFTLALINDDLLAKLLAGQAEEQAREPSVYIFGAGHVGRALALAMRPLPVNILLIDNRAEELELADQGIAQEHTILPEALVRVAPAGSAFVVLTHDHALDFLIAREALARADAAYVGMIGSKTKRAVFISWLKSQTGLCPDFNALVMPIGKSLLADKRPSVIAAMVAAQIMEAVGVSGKTTGRDSTGNKQRKRISV